MHIVPWHSVWPKVMSTRASSCCWTRTTNSLGTVVPPVRIVCRLVRSCRPRCGWSKIAISIVGTASVSVPRSASVSSRNKPASNPGITTCVPARARVPTVARPAPPIWNSGIALIQVSAVSSPNPARRVARSYAADIPPCVSIAPFGTPVVPDVYWI